MKITKQSSFVALILLTTTVWLFASGPAGIYGIVSKVVFEPNDKAPERIQIWGAFTFVEGGTRQTLMPRRGYLYFSLPASGRAGEKETTLKEWADFKAIAGTGQAVAFGRFFYFGAFSDELVSPPAGTHSYVLIQGSNDQRSENPLRAESNSPTSPDPYPLNMGVTKLSSTGDLAAVVKQLQQTLKP